MKLLENYNSAKAKYGDVADTMRAARISDGFLLSACRFFVKNGVPPEQLFNYFHQWCVYVLRHKRIDVNTLEFDDFYNIIQEYKNKYGIPNQIYNDGKVVIGELKSNKDLSYFPIKTNWCISQASMFATYVNDPMAYNIYIIDNGERGKCDADRFVCMLIDKNGSVSCWDLYNNPMTEDNMMSYDKTLTQGALMFIGNLCNDRIENNQNSSSVVTESALKTAIGKYVKEAIRDCVEQECGKYSVIDGDGLDHTSDSLKQFGTYNHIRMYDSAKDTYCLMRRRKNGMYFFTKIVDAPELGKDETKFIPVKQKAVPPIILRDAKSLIRSRSIVHSILC